MVRLDGRRFLEPCLEPELRLEDNDVAAVAVGALPGESSSSSESATALSGCTADMLDMNNESLSPLGPRLDGLRGLVSPLGLRTSGAPPCSVPTEDEARLEGAADSIAGVAGPSWP